MSAYLRKFLSLESRRRRLLFSAWIGLGKARIALVRFSLKQITSTFSRLDSSARAPELDESAMKLAQDIGWAVRAAAAVTPWNSSCLVQVLAAQRMLQGRGIPGAFYIGAAAGEGSSIASGMKAHAWLMCGSQFITGESGRERYSVISAFGWESA